MQEELEKEINKEINSRLEFKRNEILTSIKNHIQNHQHFAFLTALDNNLGESNKHQHYREAYQTLMDIVKKEFELPTPSDHMYTEETYKIKEGCVQSITEKFDSLTRGKIPAQGRFMFIRHVASAVEKAIRS